MDDPRYVEPHIAAKRSADQAVAELAARQHGVLAREQLLALGLTRHDILDRDRHGHLHRIHRGVYAVGHTAVTRSGRWMAAVLAGGPTALLSYFAGAWLWRMRSGAPAVIDVTVRESRRARPGICFHRDYVPPDERTVLDGIPVTTMPRTLFDLAAVLDQRQLERAINEADYLQLTDPLSLHDLIARYPRRAGARNLRAALAARSKGATRTRSDLEELFLALIDRYGLPRPRINAFIPGIGEVDCAWPHQRLVVELDGRMAHATLAAFEQDRERDRLLQAAGWRVIRLTWRQLEADGAKLVADLRNLLGATVSR